MIIHRLKPSSLENGMTGIRKVESTLFGVLSNLCCSDWNATIELSNDVFVSPLSHRPLGFLIEIID